MAHEPLRLHLAFQLPQRERLALLTAVGEHDLLALRTLLPLLDVVGIAEPLHKLQLRDHNLVHPMFLKRRLGVKQGDGDRTARSRRVACSAGRCGDRCDLVLDVLVRMRVSSHQASRRDRRSRHRCRYRRFRCPWPFLSMVEFPSRTSPWTYTTQRRP